MKIIESLLTKNRCYQKGEKIVVKGLMLHSIGCPQPSAKALVQSWNSASAGTCVHAFGRIPFYREPQENPGTGGGTGAGSSAPPDFRTG